MTDKPLIVLLLLLAVWALPIVIAFKRDHPQRFAIAALTTLFSWTFIGWGLAVIWSLVAVRRPTR